MKMFWVRLMTHFCSDKRIVNLDKLAGIVAKYKKNKKKVILCHGVFDLLHIGHIKHFKEAKSFGDILIVTLTADKFVNKGPNRPVFNENLRLEFIAALSAVDYVALNKSKTAINPINKYLEVYHFHQVNN